MCKLQAAFEHTAYSITKHTIIVKVNAFAMEQGIQEQPGTALRFLDHMDVLAKGFLVSCYVCSLFPGGCHDECYSMQEKQ